MRSSIVALAFLHMLVAAQAPPAQASPAQTSSTRGSLGAASEPADPDACEARRPAEGAPAPHALAAAGQAWRIATRRGPVRVWVPDGYEPAAAATVVYVHGYYVSVDEAWREHRLPEQFAASRLNALFIVGGAPEGPRERVTWPSLTRLLATVARGVPVELPAGRVVAIGHSGAHRTLATWLDERRLRTIALVDAAYDDLAGYRAWLGRSRHRRLITVGADTRRRTDRFHRALPGSRVVEGFPPPAAGTLPADVRSARVLYIRASRGHMDLVTDGVALPMLLRTLRGPLVGDQPRSSPLVPLRQPDGDAPC
ncbi:MAG TPA: hypothetical protein VK932_21695 [Kofleriaceae bacterium]|nr:hypothetical protein [Kofleriaceae bacterium]